MKHTFEYIKEKTIEYTLEILEDGSLVTCENYNEDSEIDLHTVNSHHQDMMSVWTLDFDYDDETESKIEDVVREAILSIIPDEMKSDYSWFVS